MPTTSTSTSEPLAALAGRDRAGGREREPPVASGLTTRPLGPELGFAKPGADPTATMRTPWTSPSVTRTRTCDGSLTEIGSLAYVGLDAGCRAARLGAVGIGTAVGRADGRLLPPLAVLGLGLDPELRGRVAGPLDTDGVRVLGHRLRRGLVAGLGHVDRCLLEAGGRSRGPRSGSKRRDERAEARDNQDKEKSSHPGNLRWLPERFYRRAQRFPAGLSADFADFPDRTRGWRSPRRVEA